MSACESAQLVPRKRTLRHETPDRPNIDRFAVRRIPDEELRAAVPSRGHVVRVARARPRERARKSKVAQLENPRAREEEVLGLYVAVNDLVCDGGG